MNTSTAKLADLNALHADHTIRMGRDHLHPEDFAPYWAGLFDAYCATSTMDAERSVIVTARMAGFLVGTLHLTLDLDDGIRESVALAVALQLVRRGTEGLHDLQQMRRKLGREFLVTERAAGSLMDA